MAVRLKLSRGFTAAWAGDTVAVFVTDRSVRVRHHESDPGQPIAWLREILYTDILDIVVVDHPDGLLAYRNRTAGGDSPEGFLTITFQPAAGARRPKAIALQGKPADLRELEMDLITGVLLALLAGPSSWVYQRQGLQLPYTVSMILSALLLFAHHRLASEWAEPEPEAAPTRLPTAPARTRTAASYNTEVRPPSPRPLNPPANLSEQAL